MEYIFKDIIIFAFDLHTTVAPLVNEKLLTEDMRFLVKPESYQQYYETGQAVNTVSFEVSPLPVEERKHYFWSVYGSILERGDGPDFWRLQIPLICEVKKTSVVIDTGDINIKASILPTIYLSALGWSTNLYIHLTGEIDSDSLINIVGKLFHLTEKPFLVEGSPQTITGVFGHFASRLRAEIYTQQKPPIDKMSVEKHFVLAPAEFSGKIQYYYPPSKQDHPAPTWVSQLSAGEEMSQSDCALMLSFLYGHPVSISDWFNWSYKNFMHTKLRGPGFALTDYEQGTFLFMQENAAEKAQLNLRKALWCYASNVRLSTMMTVFLLKFYNLSKKEEKLNKVAQLRQAIKIIIEQMPTNYPNAVCRNMHRWNDEIKALLSTSQ